jgi:hypothetical protein
MKWFRFQSAPLLLTAGALFLFAGCGRGTGSISGKVTLDGQALPGGLLSVTDSEDQVRTGRVQPDGAYSISNIAPGAARITVQTLKSLPTIRSPNPKDAEPFGKFVEIPLKYGDKDKSGIKLDVKTGMQEFNIELKSEASPAPG